MRLPAFQYLGPKTKEEALELINKHRGKVKIIAGGTDLINGMRHRLATPAYVMSLRGVTGLRGIKKRKGELVIAACTTLREVAESPLILGAFSSLSQAAGLVAAPPIQNIATIGGNLLQSTRCLFYNQSLLVRDAAPPCVKQGGKTCIAVKGSKHCFSVYQGDLAPALVALDAKVILQRAGGSRTIPVPDLFTGKGKDPLMIEDDEMLTDIVIPVPKGMYGSSYEKLRMRRGLEYPLVGASAYLSLSKRGVIDSARVVISAVGPAPILVEEAAPFLVGKTLEEADIAGAAEACAKAGQPVDNLAMPGSYRKKMIKVFAKRAIEEALRDAQKAGA
jgi:4-hydroxybenzoyl-CoA reductase subunit beta